MMSSNISPQVHLPLIGIERHRLQTDGVGVTTLVGSFGCPLKCAYCLNPHAWNPATRYRFVTPEELLETVKIDDLYFQATGGGITFGGGESLLHTVFIREFKKICPKSWKLYAETSLNVPSKNIRDALNAIDDYIIDIKDMNPEIYKAYTGMNNDRVYRNLEFLLKEIGPEHLYIRVPFIPSYNTKEDMENSIQLLKDMGLQSLEPFSYVIRG